MTRYLIVGDGVAGARAAVKIRETDPQGEIHIFTEEAYPFYYRVRFPEFIAGEVTAKEITIHSEEWYRSRGITLHLEEKIVGGDSARGEIFSEKGTRYGYDRLLIATGGVAFVPPIRGTEKTGVFTLRSMKDALAMKAFSGGIREAVLIGGGLVGLETGGALIRHGIKVSVIERNPRILPRQTDPDAAGILQGRMEEMGFRFFLNSDTEEILGGEKAEGVRLKDGRVAEGQMVILSAGVRPNVDLGRSMGLEVSTGIPVNDRMETVAERVFAAGDVAEHRGRCYGIWPAAQRQGETAGVNMAGGKALYEGTVVSNTLKVVGIDLTATGEIDPEKKLECVVRSEAEKCVYCKVAFKENRVVGCIFLGEAGGKNEVLSALGGGADVKAVKESLLARGFEPGTPD
jgi:nitrite reductase (NADH) large subunit